MRRQKGPEDEEVDTHGLDSVVVIVGGPKGHAYRADFNPDSDYQSMSVQITPLPYTPLNENNPSYVPKLTHRGCAPLLAATSVTLSGMEWPVESHLAR